MSPVLGCVLSRVHVALLPFVPSSASSRKLQVVQWFVYESLWYGVVCYGMVWYGMVWYGMVWYGMVWYGMVWYGMVWYGMVWYGMVWYGMVWYGMVSINLHFRCFLVEFVLCLDVELCFSHIRFSVFCHWVARGSCTGGPPNPKIK